MQNPKLSNFGTQLPKLTYIGKDLVVKKKHRKLDFGMYVRIGVFYFFVFQKLQSEIA
jgi:hypothetical protein